MTAGRLRRILRIAFLVVLATVALAWGLIVALRPPSLVVPERRTLVLQDVTLVEPGKPPRAHVDLIVENGRIASIAPTGSVSGAESIVARGLFVAPGLIDMHVHYPPRVAVGNGDLWSLLFLAHGVTAVREPGSIDGSSFEIRRRVRGGRLPGPRIFTCGSMLDGSPASFPTNRVVSDAEEARRAVADQVERGVDCIKVYNMISADALEAAIEAADAAGLPVIGHKPHAVGLGRMAGADLQHLTGAPLVDLEAVGTEDYRVEDWATVDESRIAEVVEASLGFEIAHTPTLVNARLRRRLSDARSDAGTEQAHLPAFWRQVWPIVWRAPETGPRYEAMRDIMKTLTARLYRAGVTIHAGSDTLMPYVAPGAALVGELEELVDAGLTPEEVLGIATRDAGLALGVEGLGTLEVGAPADLILLQRDPTIDLAALASLEGVVADGRWYPRADLRAAQARYRVHFEGFFYSTSMEMLVRLMVGRFQPENSR